MNYNLESFTDEERERVEALINQIKEEKKKKENKKEEERMFYSNGWNDFGFNITKKILSMDSDFPQNIDELIARLGLMPYREIIETKMNRICTRN